MEQAEIEITTDKLTQHTCPGRWQVAAAQTCGTDHETKKKDCQDVYSLAMVSPDALIIAVADGAGSTTHGQIGASVAVNKATGQLCARLAEAPEPLDEITLKDFLHDTMVAARGAVEGEATARRVSSHELSTTLILMIARREFVAVAQVGDGATVIADHLGTLTGLTVPPVAEYINETTFLTSPEAVRTMQFVFWRGCATRLAAFSDGLQLLCLQWPERLPYGPFFSPLFDFIGTGLEDLQTRHELVTFLSSEKIKRQTDDDLTLVLASTTNCANEH